MRTHLKPFLRGVALAVAAACLITPALAQQTFYLHNGDRVVFYGDSITEQRLYTNHVEDFVLTRYPELKVSFTNSGVGGDRVSGGWAGGIEQRLQRDLFPYQPTVITIMLGMNDGQYAPLTPAIDQAFTSGYQHILQEIHARLPQARLTLIDPSPYDDVTRTPSFAHGYNHTQVLFSQFLDGLARQDHDQVADFNTPMVAMLRRAEDANPELAQKIIRDRIHPGWQGHWVMAEALLESWGATPLVSAVELDANGRLQRAANATVSGLAAAADGLSWTELDRALPLPINANDPTMRLVLDSSDVVDKLDQETLRVAGLAPGSYALSIDGKDVAHYTAEQLAAGVNLALESTPMLAQADNVARLTNEHNALRFAVWRQIDIPLASDNLEHKLAARNALLALEQDVLAEREQAAQPVTHHFLLHRQ